MLQTLGRAAGATAGALLLAGCASVDIAKTFNGQELTAGRSTPVAHVHGDCWGIYLLPICPLVTGETGTSGAPVVFVKDTVNVEAVTDITTRKSKELGATRTVDLASHSESVWIAPLLIFWYKDMQVSGNAIK